MRWESPSLLPHSNPSVLACVNPFFFAFTIGTKPFKVLFVFCKPERVHGKFFVMPVFVTHSKIVGA